MNDKQFADQIIARAQSEVASRRAAGLDRRWGGRLPWLLPTLVLAVLVAFLAAPLEEDAPDGHWGLRACASAPS